MVIVIKTLIIGAGVVGSAIAYKLSRTLDNVFVIESNHRIPGENQSTRSNGVVHAGIYYNARREPLKTKHCVDGNRQLYELSQEHDIQYKRTGKIVAANGADEEEYLGYTENIARENGVEFRCLSGTEVKNLEPNITATKGLYFPSSGIIDVVELIKKLRSLAERNGATFAIGNKVINIDVNGKRFVITTRSNSSVEIFEAESVINAAGLYSDEIARMVNAKSTYEVIPVRGEAAKFYITRSDIEMGRMNVYPVPYAYYNETGEIARVKLRDLEKLLDKKVVTLTVGTHLTPTFDEMHWNKIGNTVIIGPLKTTRLMGKDDYAYNLRQREEYLKAVNKFAANLRLEDIQLHHTGIMGILKDHPDFLIEPDIVYPNFINLLGISSPGLTAALSIADYVTELRRNL